jgi:hypothetical protein
LKSGIGCSLTRRIDKARTNPQTGQTTSKDRAEKVKRQKGKKAKRQKGKKKGAQGDERA